MSKEIRLRFDHDMPAAAVEVFAPDHGTVRRVAMRPGLEERFEVPSERSVVRVHLPSGRVVTLRRRPDLDYVIRREELGRGVSRESPGTVRSSPRGRSQSIQAIRGYQAERSAASFERRMTGTAGWLDEMYAGSAPLDELTLEPGIHAEWTPAVEGRRSADGAELSFSPDRLEEPYALSLRAGDTTLTVSLPGTLESVYVRSDDVSTGGLLVSIRVATESPLANTMGGYLARGDYYAAEAMAPLTTELEQLLSEKRRDPFAAATAGYLLLQLERFDLMHDWARNLAEWFPAMSDGCVIWAAQALRQHRDIDEATKYFRKGAERGWPVFTAGTRILSGSLRRIEGGDELLRSLEKKTSLLQWESPFTAQIDGHAEWDGQPITFDIGYEPLA